MHIIGGHEPYGGLLDHLRGEVLPVRLPDQRPVARAYLCGQVHGSQGCQRMIGSLNVSR